MVLTSQKSADALEECISTKLSVLSLPSTIRGEGRRTLSFGSDLINLAAITIIEGEPRIVEVREGSILNKRFRNMIRECV